ncbi:MAG: hypothetical protein CMP24_07525 [Rickettsiales bacterium]|nr:hypothetical protein [Rickettsiales bacterium]
MSLISKILEHKTAANLFLMLMLILGLYSSKVLNTQFFPTYSVDYITISTEWLGSSPEDIEESIIKPIEEKVRYIDRVKNTKSTAKENLANILLEFEANTNMERALNDVEREIKSITSLPEGSKTPEIKLFIPYEQIGLVLVKGNISEGELKKAAKDLKQNLLDKGIDKIEIEGVRKQIIYVDLDPVSLFANSIDTSDVKERINLETKNIPSGLFRDESLLQIRAFGKRDNVIDIGNIKIANNLQSNNYLKISDIANIHEGYDYNDSSGISNKKKAFTLRIFRSLGNDTLKSTKILENSIAEYQSSLSKNVEIKIYDLSSQLIRDRINLLLKNGFGGLILVLIVLFLFLRSKVVVWVAIGIPAAISVTLAIMLISGQSINMISLFALIMMLGIIVDDSIVVAEHIDYQYEKGNSPERAAFIGSTRMLGPVLAASMTTVAAFAPVFLISGVIGQVIEAIPLVAISVLIASFFECFFVLPGHLKTALLKEKLNKPRKIFNLNNTLNSFKENRFVLILEKSIKYKYITFTTAVSLLIFAFALVITGHVKFYFFPSPESQIILVNYNFLPGTAKKKTVDFANSLEEQLKKIDEFGIVQTSYSSIGKPMWGSRISTSETGEHIGGMLVEITSPESRKIRTKEFIEMWKKEIKLVPDLKNLTIVERKGGPPGLDVDIRLMSKDKELKELKEASNFIKKKLDLYRGISDIRDNLPLGKRQINIELTEKGKILGFDTKYVAQKIKGSFEGVSATKFFRGEEEIEVIVRNDPKKYNLVSLKSFLIKSPEGKLVPLVEVVDINKSQGFSEIKRRNGYREISITAEINEVILNPDDFLKEFKKGPLQEVEKRFDIEWKLAGRQEEQSDTFGDMKRGAFLAFAVIYLILAFIFQSYSLPISIMSVIPFTLIGVIIGHWITGFDITILSLVAVLGLSGIVINDSIIMVSNIYEKTNEGMDLQNAVIKGSKERLRAVLLTSLTTIGGLTPLLFETSVQAQFLKPMAITIVFGLMSSTVLVLIFIPAILLLGSSIKKNLLSPKFRNQQY